MLDILVQPAVVFWLVLTLLAVVDLATYKIPNAIIIPAIGWTVYSSGEYVAAVLMFAIGAFFFGCKWECPSCGHVEGHIHKYSIWRGGDVKLLTFLGAFMGLKAVYILMASLVLLYAYRSWYDCHQKRLPYTPFVLIAALPTLFM